MAIANNIQQADKRYTIRIAYSLLKDYLIHSDHKLKAWLLLIGALLCIVGIVGLFALIGWWSVGFMAILIAKASLSAFLGSLGQGLLLIAGFTALSSLKNYLIGKLSILWRNWLTKKIIHDLFYKDNNYLDLKRFPHVVDNISQRVQEDTGNVVDIILNLGSTFVQSILGLGASTTTLWIVGGALTVALVGLNIVIPGYLVWIALFTAVVVTVSTFFISKKLPQIKQNMAKSEADLRQDINQLNNEAENIAEEKAEKYYERTLTTRVQNLKDTAETKLKAETKTLSFQSFYANLLPILPWVLTAPLYFSGAIEMSQFMQIGNSFMQVSTALNMLADSYQTIATLKASMLRVQVLQEALEKDGLANANQKAIVIKERDKPTIRINLVNITQPQASSASCIMRSLKMKLQPKEHVLINGPSGLGKSTLFKVIAGSWKYGEGKVSIPANQRLYFLPQEPVLPTDTLRAVLAYPEPVSTYQNEQYPTALRAVGMPEEFIGQLDEKRNWSKELSGGQRQRISLARALMKKPEWLFLDEATSSLDETSEAQVYRVMLEQLKDTTIVSIGHRSTIKQFHTKVVFFHPNNERDVTVEETMQPRATVI